MLHLIYISIIILTSEIVQANPAGLATDDINCNQPNGTVIKVGNYIPAYHLTNQRVQQCIKCACINKLIQCSYTKDECQNKPPTIDNERLNENGMPMLEESILPKESSSSSLQISTIPTTTTTTTTFKPPTTIEVYVKRTSPKRKHRTRESWKIKKENTPDDPNDIDNFKDDYDSGSPKPSDFNLNTSDDKSIDDSSSVTECPQQDESITTADSSDDATTTEAESVQETAETESEQELTTTQPDVKITTTSRAEKPTQFSSQFRTMTRLMPTNIMKTTTTTAPLKRLFSTTTTTTQPTTTTAAILTTTDVNLQEKHKQLEQLQLELLEQQMKLKKYIENLPTNSISNEPKVAYSHEYPYESINNKISNEFNQLISLTITSMVGGCVLVVALVCLCYFIYGCVQINKIKDSKTNDLSSNKPSTFQKAMMKTNSDIEFYV